MTASIPAPFRKHHYCSITTSKSPQHLCLEARHRWRRAMVLEPSAKSRRGGTSNQKTEVDVIQVPGQKLDYTKRLSEVDIHAKEKLDVFYTSNLDVANEMTNRIRMKLGGLIPPFIGVDVEYAREEEPLQRAPVL
ncbi:hypothetical protein D1007_13345 [Hordeum vulgare]|nr:hypothetical protein D1007_13345 [Hordeum vulgare]